MGFLDLLCEKQPQKLCFVYNVINEIDGIEQLCYKPDCLLVVNATIWCLFTKVLGKYY